MGWLANLADGTISGLKHRERFQEEEGEESCGSEGSGGSSRS